MKTLKLTKTTNTARIGTYIMAAVLSALALSACGTVDRDTCIQENEACMADMDRRLETLSEDQVGDYNSGLEACSAQFEACMREVH